VAAVIVLTLLGLSGIMPALMLALATIVMAAAFLLEGEVISMRFSKLLAETSSDRLDEAEFGLGLTSEVVGGIAGLFWEFSRFSSCIRCTWCLLP
jgi:hypothetical protein